MKKKLFLSFVDQGIVIGQSNVELSCEMATKLENKLGRKADENFDTGIIKTVDWYLKNTQSKHGRILSPQLHSQLIMSRAKALYPPVKLKMTLTL